MRNHPLLIQTPNARNDYGYNRDRFIFNPAALTDDSAILWRFFGTLLAVAVRTKKPLDLRLAPCIWKLLSAQPLTPYDIQEIDLMFMQTLKSINEMEESSSEEFQDIIPIEFWQTFSSDGRLIPVVPGGSRIKLTWSGRKEYVEKALETRLHEMDKAVKLIREGMASIIPVPLLSLVTPNYLEQLVCGHSDINIDVLKHVVRYRELNEQSEVVRWFWHTLESFSNEEKVLFMRFVSGRSRLPANPADISQRFQLMKVDRAIDGLPTAQTCFFQLRLPPYSSRDALASKLRYAIQHCKCIDMDNYMLARNNEADVAPTLIPGNVIIDFEAGDDDDLVD